MNRTTSNRSHGFALIETTFGFILAIGLVGAVWNLFGPATTTSSVMAESARLTHLRSAVLASHASSVDFAGLSVMSPVYEGYATAGSASATETAWGPLGLNPSTIRQPDDSFEVDMVSIPADACQRLVAAQQGQWTSIHIDGVAQADGDEACLAGDTHALAFIQDGGVRHGAAPLAAL